MNQLLPTDFQQQYLAAMLAGSSRAADRVVEQALAQGINAPRIYLDIFQPTAYEIGRLWQINRIGIAQEHLATAIIERQMGELHP
ncbi:MAG: B12-binding domain-containing protein [Chloroflexus sp.]